MSLRSSRSSLLAALALGLVATVPSTASATELITNGNFDAGVTGFNTTYDQTDAGGYIFVTTNPALLCSSCFPSMGDRTTGTGNMLFVDGAGVGDGLTPASQPYYSVTLGVVPNSAYAFSYWAANLGPSNQPIPVLATYLDGILMGVPTTPDYAQWTLFSFLFNSGSSSTITLSLSDLTATHSFNDFAFDDVSLQGPVPGDTGVPEPSTWLMMLVGFGVLGVAARRRRKKALAAT